MAEKATPDKFTYNPGAGSSAGGGGGGGDGDGGGAAAPSPAPRRDLSSPPRSPSPPAPFTYNPSGGGARAAPTPPARQPGPSSSQPLPPPFPREVTFTYNPSAGGSGGGVRAAPTPPARQPGPSSQPLPPSSFPREEPLSLLVRAGPGKPIFQQKYKILSEHYVCFRPMRKDRSQFYRAFLFSYLENLGKMQGSQAEINRLMECLARSRENFCLLRWDNAYFSNPEAFFSSVVSEFEHLVSSVANGLNADDLYKRCLQEITSSRKVHICTNEAYYKSVFGPHRNALLFCINSVRPFDADAGLVQMRALSDALGVPLHLALPDNTININGNVQVQFSDFLPLSESGVSRSSGPVKSIISYYLSSATDEHPAQGREVMPAGNLFSSDCMPLVTLLKARSGSCARSLSQVNSL